MSWWQQVAVFSKSYRCITFDHRGFGQSEDVPDGPGRHAYVDDLKALLDYLGIQDAFLVAQSMGGLSCLPFAVAYPERTEGWCWPIQLAASATRAWRVWCVNTRLLRIL